MNVVRRFLPSRCLAAAVLLALVTSCEGGAADPLISLDSDVATKRAIAALAQKGPMVVVGHSYGGMVNTGAAADAPQVKALIYVNAFAPEIGKSAGYLLASGPPTKLSAALLRRRRAAFADCAT